MRRVPSNRFITVFYGVLDPVGHRLDYVNAGQNIPLLVHDDGSIERLRGSGRPLGMFRDEAYSQGSLALRPGDLFVCYSDGATEATNDDGIQFGVDRLEKVTRTVRGQEPREVIASVWRALDRFHQDRPPEDDITILALCRR
jgi:serine phosphatase RsbU (regulator of sigma subunit)